MKNFLKPCLTKNNLIIIAVFLFAAGVRFYNFPERVTFWSEQARSLMVSANYIKEKPSLLGQEYFRVDSTGHKMFSGAVFNYSLVPLLLISDYDPVIVTVFFALLNLATGFAVYFTAKKIFNERVGVISAFLFLFNNYMIYHSLFIWNYNFLPLVGILSFYFSYLFFKKHTSCLIFILGLLGGIGASLQVLFLPFAGLVYLVNIQKSNKRLSDSIIFILGMILGNLPMVIFDLRHDFYHLKTVTQYLTDTLRGSSDAGLAYYYFLPLWPVGAVLLGKYLSKLNKYLIFAFLGVYLFLNLESGILNLNAPTGMPVGLTVRDIDHASQIVARDAGGRFNVASVLDFDKRAYVLRYFVEFKYGKKPESETDYQNLKSLYVLAQKEYNFRESSVWEIKSGGEYKISKLSDVGQGYAVFKLEK